jgi:hypothetical protein
MVAYCLAEGSRPAMYHQPEPIFFIRLHLKKVVTAAKRCKLNLALLSTNCL